MSSFTKAAVVIGIAILFAVGLVFWQVKIGRASTIILTPEDMVLIAEDQSPMQRVQLAESDKTRQQFSNNIKQIVALGEEARQRGIADRPEVKRQLELLRTNVIAQNYALAKLKEEKSAPGESGKPLNPNELGPLINKLVPQSEIEKLTADPVEKKQFEEFAAEVQKLGFPPPAPREWAITILLERRAVAEGLDRDRRTQLQIILQQSLSLARIYVKEVVDSIKVTDEELKKFIAKHPEYDEEGQKHKAETILNRIKSGEDFSSLAKQFSDDPGSRMTGGDLDWLTPGQTVKEFNDAAFALQPGQISELVKSSFGFHIIKIEERRTGKNEEGKEQPEIHARHILIRIAGTPEAPGAKNKPLSEQAHDAIKNEIVPDKIKALIEDAVKRSRVVVAQDFKIVAPAIPAPPPGMAPNQPGSAAGADDNGP